MGEVLCIIRPLVYVLFIRKYGIRSWTPWLVSLAVDLTGVGILSYVTRRAAGDQEQPFSLSVSEKNEVGFFLGFSIDPPPPPRENKIKQNKKSDQVVNAIILSYIFHCHMVGNFLQF